MRFARLALAAAIVAGATTTLARPAAADLTAPDLSEAWGTGYPTQFGLGASTVADVDGDGVPEIVIAGHDGILRVLRGNGAVMWERPVQVTPGGPAVAVDSAPTVADLDGDGQVEILVGAQSISVSGQSGGVVAFDRAGNVRWRWAGGEDIFSVWSPAWGTRPDGYREGTVTSPAVGDINGDGSTDVVVGALDNRVHVLDKNGVELSGWSSRGLPGFWVDDSIFSTPAVFDGDGDGRDEIYLGVAASAGGFIDHAGGVFLSLGWNGSGPAIEWRQDTGEVMNSSPAVGDIDGDGRPEVVTGAGWDYASVNGTADARGVFAWHTDDGSPVPGWPQFTNGSTFSSPALGDLDGDGRPEVVIGTDPRPGAGTGDGKVYAFRGDGSVLWSVDPHQYVAQIKTWEGGGGIVGSPIVADINGDGVNDVVISNPWGTFTMNGRDGSRLFAPIRKGWTSQNTPAVGLFGGLGWRLVVAGYQSETSSSLVSIPIATPRSASPWPMAHGTADHRGVFANAAPQCPTLPLSATVSAAASDYHPVTPARIADTRIGLGADKRAVGARCGIALQVLGTGGVPATGVRAVTLNVTVAQPMADGYVTVYPCGVARPERTSNLNFVRGQSVANLVTVGVGAGGQVCLWAYTQAHLVVDVAGWFGDGGSHLSAVSPTRFLDTRTGTPGRPAGPVPGGQVIEIPMAGVSPLPAAGLSAVSLNLTAVDGRAGGYLTAYPCGGTVPTASNVNFDTGQTRANHVVVPLGSNGRLCVYASVASDVLVDVMGYYAVSGSTHFHSITPGRLVDTRETTRLGAGQSLRVQVAGLLGVTSGATGVALNVTAVNPSGAGYLTVYPCGTDVPWASSVNFTPGSVVPNYVAVGTGSGGAVCVYTSVDTDVLVDVSGWFG